MIELTLDYIPPLDVDALLEHFARRAVPGIEEVRDDVYARSLRLPGGPGVVEVRFAGPRAPIHATLRLAAAGDRDAAVARLRALLDLDADPAAVTDALGADPLLGPALAAAPGRRVPGAAEPTELAVRAILGQQISLAGAATAAGRLVATHGDPLPAALARGPVTHLFPTAEALAAADPGQLRMPRARARSLVGVAAALAGEGLVLARGDDPAAARAALLALPGIGPWTADYVIMRVLGDHDVFLATDLGVRRALERSGMAGDAAAAAALARRWRPYRSYAMQYLWALPSAAGRSGGLGE